MKKHRKLPKPAKRSGHVKKSYSMPVGLYNRMRDAMDARGLENESAFIQTALSQHLAERAA